VQFGMELKSAPPLPSGDDKAETGEPAHLPAPPAAAPPSGASQPAGEKVVSLDAFRKK
jgi:hypothetical protein